MKIKNLKVSNGDAWFQVEDGNQISYGYAEYSVYKGVATVELIEEEGTGGGLMAVDAATLEDAINEELSNEETMDSYPVIYFAKGE